MYVLCLFRKFLGNAKSLIHLIFRVYLTNLKMAKNKKGISENMRKKSVPTVAVNKFEIKINKQKNKVLGQKPTKHDRGMPGVSKSKSIKKVAMLIFNILKSFRNIIIIT